MNRAQVTFIVTSWMLIILAALLFLVPSSYPSIEGAAWLCLGVGIASHFALLVAIIYDQFVVPPTDSPTDS